MRVQGDQILSMTFMLQQPESFVQDPPDEKKESMQTVWRVISDVISNILGVRVYQYHTRVKYVVLFIFIYFVVM